MFRKLILVSAISVALLPSGAAALGLGAMHAQTALNQPFVGEIDLLDTRPDELDTVKARLASPEAFAEVGAERFHHLTKLRFTPQLSARGRPVVRVTSNEPVREPYMALLIEVLWPTGRLVREYTVLLDLPSTTSRPAPRVAPPPVSRPAASRRAAPSVPERPARRPRQKAPAATGEAAVSSDGFPLRYGPVPAGRGLWQVARRVAPAGATVPQTAMALYRNNQHAFAVGDINRLLVDQRLEIPSRAELLALDPAAAEIEFQAALVGKPVRRTPLTDAAAVAAQEGPTQLKIAGSGAGRPGAGSSVDDTSVEGAGGIDDIEQELLLVREAGESTRQETDHLHERIRQLESQLSDIQRLLMLRNQQLAQLQSSSHSADGAPTVDDSGIPLVVAAMDADAVAVVSADQEPGSSDVVSSTGELINLPDADASMDTQSADADEPRIADGSDPDTVEVSQQSSSGEDRARLDQSDQPVSLLNTAGEAPGAAPPVVSVPPEVIESPSFLDSLPLPWLGAGAAALGLGGLLTSIALRRRRRSAEEQQEMARSLPAEPVEDKPESVDIESESEAGPLSLRPDIAPDSSLDTGGEELLASFHTGFPLEEDSGDADVLSEADIYIAYGRYREAEDLLKEELSKYPGRADLQFKLAEVYYGAGDRDALTVLSDQMRHTGADRQDEEQWQQLVSMKQALEASGDDVGGPPSISSFGVQPSATSDARDLTGLADRVGEDQGAAGRAEPEDQIALDLGLDLSSVRESLAESGIESAPAMEELGEVEEMDLEILADQVVSSDDTTGGSESFDLALPDSEALGLPSFPEDDRALDNAPAVGGETEPRQRQETADELASCLADTAGASISPRIRELNDDDLSSELLSSQWQMDAGAWDEIGTKMELALAYMDMDDHDGARAILEEIKREGNDEQRAEADELLAKLP